MMRLFAGLVALGALAGPARAGGTAQHGLRVPAGFEVTEYADSRLANDIYTLTIDPRGRVVVAGRGYIRVLVDDDGDGRADRAIDFADGPKDGAMGLLGEGDALYAVGDGGLRRFRDRDGDGKADGPPELLWRVKTGGEHDAHAVRRGPDGWLYLLCGNNAGIDRSYARLPTSPIKEPVAGCVLRFPPDFSGCEVVADGFRNPYGMDFGPDGELFTFDSDNERCVSLPWYEPTRFYHVVPGRHYGWLAPQRAVFWRLPPHFCDVVAPVATFGRGSPTGVACYRHAQFPPHYRGGFFLCDWTFGRVYFAPLRRSGASYTCEKEVFLQAVGDNGFAPTGIVVHPTTGDLFISIGGRGTRGAVYRIHYKGSEGQAQAQPLAPRSLDWRPGLRQQLPSQARAGDALQRLRALIALRRHAARLDGEALRKAVVANWDHADRLVRAAAVDLVSDLPPDERHELGKHARAPWQQLTFALATYRQDTVAAISRTAPLIADPGVQPESRAAAVRAVQLALGGLVAPGLKGTVWEGYSPRQDLSKLPAAVPARALVALRRAFPSGNTDLDRELSRTLAVLQDEDPTTLARVAAVLANTVDPVEQTHYLIVLGRLRAPRPAAVTARTADALLGLDRRFTERHLNRDFHWPLRMRELYAELARRDGGLHAALLAHKEFGRPDHVLFALAAGFDRARAARHFLARAGASKDFAWNAGLVKLVGTLPAEECLPVLCRLWGKAGLEAALLPVLARAPRPEDRGKFLTALGSPDLATVRLGLEALERLPRRHDPAEAAALVTALGRLPAGKEGARMGEAIAARLRDLTGKAGPGADPRAWAAWLAAAHPDLAARLGNPDGVDLGAWERRARRLDWSAGDAGRGRAVFVKASCAACHSGGQALGPDLHGVTGRFSRADLFTAIVQPSKDISPRYRTTLVETVEGKSYQGLVIYEAVDGILLQTPTGTVRLAGEQIAARRPSPLSLMPAGLLDPLPDREVADLYAYLRGLGAAQPK
jgi:putative membrane-bound dehydrogenase-like protein